MISLSQCAALVVGHLADEGCAALGLGDDPGLFRVGVIDPNFRLGQEVCADPLSLSVEAFPLELRFVAGHLVGSGCV